MFRTLYNSEKNLWHKGVNQSLIPCPPQLQGDFIKMNKGKHKKTVK